MPVNIFGKISDLVRGSLPEVHSFSFMDIDPIWAGRPHRASRHELLHVLEGEIAVVVGRERHQAKAGDTIVTSDQSDHVDEFDIENCPRLFYCHFTWDRELLEKLDNRSILTMPERDKVEVRSLVGMFKSCARKGGLADEILARTRLMAILATILRACSADRAPLQPGRREELLEKAKAYLQQNFSSTVSLHDVANALHVSTYYLSHVFMDEPDFTLSSYLTELRLARSLELLEQPELSIKEIAYQVGYDNANYFTKVFRKRFGTSPRSHREKKK